MPKLALPTRVSRLYPVFSLVLLLSSGVFYYAWEMTKLELEKLPDVMSKNEVLTQQLKDEKAENLQNQAILKVQNQKITETAKQLSDLSSQLDAKNLELAEKQKQLANQESQLSQNATDLEKLRSRPPLFSFANESSRTDLDNQQQALKNIISEAYDTISEIYGLPYLLSSIKITFVNEFSIAGSAGEIIIKNGSSGISMDIHLKEFDKDDFQDVNTIIHEVVHGFHGIAVFDSSALEEGITVAATDAVMEKLIANNKISAFSRLYLIINNEQYNNYNQNLTITNNNDLFYNSPDVAKVYQVIGTAWFKLYKDDTNFFKKFNEAYYSKIRLGKSSTNQLIIDTIKEVVPNYNGKSINDFLSNNKAFNPS